MTSPLNIIDFCTGVMLLNFWTNIPKQNSWNQTHNKHLWVAELDLPTQTSHLTADKAISARNNLHLKYCISRARHPADRLRASLVLSHKKASTFVQLPCILLPHLVLMWSALWWSMWWRSALAPSCPSHRPWPPGLILESRFLNHCYLWSCFLVPGNPSQWHEQQTHY